MTPEKRHQLQEIWKQRITEWQQSGLTQVDWCRKNNLKASQLTYWKKRLQAPDKKLKPLTVVGETPVRQDVQAAIILPSGIRIETTCLQVPRLINALKAIQ